MGAKSVDIRVFTKRHVIGYGMEKIDLEETIMGQIAFAIQFEDAGSVRHAIEQNVRLSC